MRSRSKFLLEFKGFTLENIKRIDVQFNPFHANAPSVREFYQGITTRKAGRTNPECVVRAKVICDQSDPLVKVQFADDHKLSINAKYLESGHLVSLIKNIKNQHQNEESI